MENKIENKHYMECDVVMLETSNKAPMSIDTTRKWLFPSTKISTNHQHLYILSNEEIKEKSKLNTSDYYYIRNHYNEWYIGRYNDSTNQFDFINNKGSFEAVLFVCKKIIATTDSSLKWSNDNDIQIIDYHFAVLPQIPQHFIEYYINEYNKGNTVSKVLVEVEKYSVWDDIDSLKTPLRNPDTTQLKIKLNKNNEVNILIEKIITIFVKTY